MSSDLLRVSNIVGFDAADGGKGHRANTANANGGKSPRLAWRQCQGYLISKGGAQTCRTHNTFSAVARDLGGPWGAQGAHKERGQRILQGGNGARSL